MNNAYVLYTLITAVIFFAIAIPAAKRIYPNGSDSGIPNWCHDLPIRLRITIGLMGIIFAIFCFFVSGQVLFYGEYMIGSLGLLASILVGMHGLMSIGSTITDDQYSKTSEGETMTTIEFFKGLDFTIKYEIQSGYAYFTVYEIIAGDKESGALYIKPDGIGLQDQTESLNEAEVFLTANVKFDGALESTIKPNSSEDKGFLHFGSKNDATVFGALLEEIYDVAAAEMTS